STAIQMCRRDGRIKAAINCDGPLYGIHAQQLVYQPVMFIIGSFVCSGLTNSSSMTAAVRDALSWTYYFNKVSLPVINKFISAQQSDTYKITINGIVHSTFADQGLSPDVSLLASLVD